MVVGFPTSLIGRANADHATNLARAGPESVGAGADDGDFELDDRPACFLDVGPSAVCLGETEDKVQTDDAVYAYAWKR